MTLHRSRAPFIGLCFLSLSLATASCSLTAPPRSADGLGPSFALREPIFGHETGQLFLLKEGLWAYLPENEANLPESFDVGALAGLDVVDGPDHLFTVVVRRPWGLLLQRLDTAPIQDKTQGRLTPVNPARGAAPAPKHPVCLGVAGDADFKACLEAYGKTRWNVYAATAKGQRVAVAPYGENDLLLPARRLGQVVFDDDVPGWFGFKADSGQGAGKQTIIAVADDRRRPPVPIVRVATFGCDETTSQPLLETVSLDQWTDLTDFLRIEGAAYEAGVDALVHCTGSEIAAFIPFLHRPMVTARDRPIGPALLGYSPLVLRSARAESLPILYQAAARVGAGDFAGADLWLELLLAHLPDGRERDGLAVMSMQIATAAGRPEAALRAGQSGTRRSWNRENDKGWLLGMAGVFHELEMRKDALTATESLVELVRRERDQAFPIWQQWATLRIKEQQGRTIHLRELEEVAAEARTEQLDGWEIALKTMALERLEDPAHGQEAKEILESAYDQHGLLPLWRAYTRARSSDPCATPSCALDPYGRAGADYLEQAALAHDVRTITNRLERVPVIDFRPGFDTAFIDAVLALAQTNPDRLALFFAAYPLVDAETREALLMGITDLITAVPGHPEEEYQASFACDELDDLIKRARFAVVRSAPSSLRPQDRQTLHTLEWFVTTALPASCEGVEALLAVIDTEANNAPATAMSALALVEARQLRDGARPEAANHLEAVASLAARHGDGDQCRRWSLALALAYALAGEIDEAKATLIRTDNCPRSLQGEPSSRDLLSAYLRYEKTGSFGAVRPGQARQTLEALSGRKIPAERCIGLEPLSFRIEDHLDPRIVALARTVQRPAGAPAALTLRTSSEAMAMAKASFSQAQEALGKGDLEGAAEALTEARREWQRLGHLPGLARVTFLEEVLYEGDLLQNKLPSAVRSDAAADGLRALRDGEALRLLDEWTPGPTSAPDTLRIFAAAALIAVDDDALADRLQPFLSHDGLATLCQLHDDSDRVVHLEAP